MGLPDLPDGWVTLDRSEIERRFKRDYALRNPDADVTSGQPDLDAKLAADLLLTVYNDARLIADGINEDEATGERLDRVGARIGLPRGRETGATGYVAVDTGGSGALYQNGVHELRNPQTKLRYEVAETRHRNNGEHIRVRARDVGPNTDLPAGAVLQFTNPPPGGGQNAVVVQQSGGRGLTGGSDRENDARYLERIRFRKQNPPAGDNDAELVALLMQTPDVPIEQVFTFPGFYGPGSTAFTFTVLPARLGATRVPALSQLQAAFAWISAQMPGDHGYFPLDIVASPLFVALAVQWATTGGWADVSPWPSYAQAMLVSAATSATEFTLTGSGVAPVAGQTIGFWDAASSTFRRKRVLTVTGSGPYAIVCDTVNGASDSGYTPAIGQRASPWSDSLLVVPTPVLTYLGTLGPGEAFTFGVNAPAEEGRRRRREPRAPKAYPYKTTNKLASDVGDLPEVLDCAALAGVGSTPAVGNPTRMLELSDLAVFAS